MNNPTRIVLIISLLLIALLTTEKAVSASGTFYVSTTGNDSNSCAFPSDSCATIQGAINKTSSGDTIKIAIGTYTASTGDNVIYIQNNLTLSGGWNESFDNQIGMSTVSGSSTQRVLNVAEVSANIEYLILQNGKNGIVNSGDLTVNHLVIQNNHGDRYCWSSGVTNYGSILIQSSRITGNDCQETGYGGGLYNWWYGDYAVIVNSVIDHNEAAVGGGIFNGSTLVVINSTISNNAIHGSFSNSQGGGIYNDRASTILRNVTIVENNGGLGGGGIYAVSGGGIVDISNSILANNSANISPDCSGSITSSGYNIIGDSANCSLTSTAGDQIDVNPKIGPLQDNGGSTLTHFIYQESPAMDAGNPAGCLDHNGNAITSDQRGVTRPLDGNTDGTTICDIGAYEDDPQNPSPHSPEATWFVSTSGSDTNNCLSPTTPCHTINAAIGKANSGDSIFIAAGTYSSPSGNQVVLIDKNINLYGGWNEDFTNQNNISIINGTSTKRGITISGQFSANLEKLDIRNGLSKDYDGGGGVYLAFRAKVKMKNCIVQNSQTSGKGGGIFASSSSNLTLNYCQITGNSASNNGGGIYHSGSLGGTLIMNSSLVDQNTSATRGGGISGGIDGTIEIKNSEILNNQTLSGSSSEGGGIYSFNSESLYLQNTLVAGNKAPSIGGNEGYGGGIRGSATTIDHCIIRDNIAQYGGGVYNTYFLNIFNSGILYNQASYGYGGGIYASNTFNLTNSTVAFNKASMPYTDEARGGGIYAGGIQISNSTIAFNTADYLGGGIWASSTTMRNTILAKNFAPVSPDCNGISYSAGYNLIGNTTGCNLTPSTGDLTNVDVILSYHYSETLALWSGSPAIDAGNPAGCTDQSGNPISLDQVGNYRPKDGNADGVNICDIGAYEFDINNPPLVFLIPLIIR